MIDLRDDDNDTWMNQVRAAREKGEPLTEQEIQRIREGKRWNVEPLRLDE